MPWAWRLRPPLIFILLLIVFKIGFNAALVFAVPYTLQATPSKEGLHGFVEGRSLGAITARTDLLICGVSRPPKRTVTLTLTMHPVNGSGGRFSKPFIT